MTSHKHIFTSLFILFWILQANWVFGQSHSDLLEQFSEAEKIYRLGNHDESIALFEDLQPALCESDLIDVCINSALLKANIYRNLGEKELFREQIAYGLQKISENKLESNPLHPEFYIQLSYFEDGEANMDAVRKYEEKAELLINDHNIEGIRKARLFVLKGYNKDTQGDYKTAIENYSSALRIVSTMNQSLEIINMLSQIYNN